MVSTKPQSSKRNSLLPYEGEKGQPIKSLQEIAQEPAFFAKYYHNHRVLHHGYLTGMVQFQTILFIGQP
jgi:hypothetical protein